MKSLKFEVGLVINPRVTCKLHSENKFKIRRVGIVRILVLLGDDRERQFLDGAVLLELPWRTPYSAL